MKIIGHRRVREMLQMYVTQAQAGCAQQHAFLFSGVTQIGKRTMAQMCANALITGKSLSWAVADCEDVQARRDMIILAPGYEEKKGVIRERQIAIEDVRKAITLLHRAKSPNAQARVLLIDHAERLSTSAAQALLKITEEPPTETYIFFVTRDVKKILPTLRSRMIHVGCTIASRQDFEKAFLDRNLYDLALGRVGRAKVIITEHALYVRAQEDVALLQKVRSMSIVAKIAMVEKLVKNDTQVQHLLNVWTWQIRSIAHAKKIFRIISLTERIENTARLLRYENVNKRLLLEELFLHL